LAEQQIERIERARILRIAVQLRDGVVDRGPDRLVVGVDLGQPLAV
jgi:hypothetical protein